MSRARLPVAVALTLCAASPAAALDPERRPSQYVVSKWDASVLGTSNVRALQQTPDGYLWVGSAAGLARFDGARFVFFEERRTPGLPGGGLSALAVSTGGALYLGTTVGAVARYLGSSFAPVEGPQARSPVSAFLAARDGSLWVGRQGKPVERWREGRRLWSPTTVPLAIAEDDRGRVWLGSGSAAAGLAYFDGASLVPVGLAGETVQALRFDRDGTLWIGTAHGLWRRRQGRLERLAPLEGLSEAGISALLADRHGNLWAGTTGAGLYRLNGAGITRLITAEGLASDRVQQLFEDHEGNLWVGTDDGLNCISDALFITYGRFEGLGEPAVTAVGAGGGRRVWIGTAGAEIARLQGDHLDLFHLPRGPLPGRASRGPASDAIIALHETRQGALWAAVDNGRLFRLQDGTLTEQTPLDTTDKVRLILEDERGPIFFVGGRLAHLQGRRLIPLHPRAPRLGYPHAARREENGTLWLGTSLGLVRVQDDHYQVFTESDGLPNRRVRSIAGDSRQGLWLATGRGLAYLHGGTLRKLTTDEGLPENYLRLVLDDGLGHLWLAGLGRIFRLDKREALDVLDGRARRLSPVSFDTSDGLRATEGILSNAPGFRGEDGRLWFATTQGASVVEAARIAADEAAPSVAIESLAVDGRTVAGADAEYGPGRGELKVEYGARAFRGARRLRFRHRLEGLDEGWVESEAHRADYRNLPPGRYRFVAEASNRYGRWSGRTTSRSFGIRPPFHRTALFYALGAASLAALGWLAHRLRLARVRARLQAVIAERTRIARELHDTLAQGLAGLGLQLDAVAKALPAGAEPAQQGLRRARAMVRSSQGEVRRSIWVLRAQSSKGVAGLAASVASSLRQLTVGAPLEATVEVRGRGRPLSPEVERSLLRIAHEAVINTVRHSGASRVAVALGFAPHGLELRVRDDGRGFDPEAHAREARGHHFGVVGMVERAESLGGRLEIQSGPGTGTEVFCFLPYNGTTEPPGAAAKGAPS